jgi:Bacterial Ig-like domain (group 2)
MSHRFRGLEGVMGDTDLSLEDLDWFESLGAPPDLIEAARKAILDGKESPDGPATASAPSSEAYSGGSATSATDEPQPITVDPEYASIAAGGAQQFTATDDYSDRSSRLITQAVVWNSSAPSISIDHNAQSGVRGTAQASVAPPGPGCDPPSAPSLDGYPAHLHGAPGG